MTEWVEKYDLSSLRILGSVGEPINPEAWMWYYEHVGKERCPIVDTWWQTETGGFLITPLPGAMTLKPGSASRPFFGVEPVVLRDDVTPCGPNEGGKLCIEKPWPGMMRTMWGDHDRFIDTYFTMYNDMYFTGDGCRIDEDGDYWLMGRIDDVVNVSGHRIGTAEVESALVSHAKVAEAAVAPMPHEIKGQALYAYVTLVDGSEPPKRLQEGAGPARAQGDRCRLRFRTRSSSPSGCPRPAAARSCGASCARSPKASRTRRPRRYDNVGRSEHRRGPDRRPPVRVGRTPGRFGARPHGWGCPPKARPSRAAAMWASSPLHLSRLRGAQEKLRRAAKDAEDRKPMSGLGRVLGDRTRVPGDHAGYGVLVRRQASR